MNYKEIVNNYKKTYGEREGELMAKIHSKLEIINSQKSPIKGPIGEKWGLKQTVENGLFCAAIFFDSKYKDNVRYSQELWKFDFEKGRLTKLDSKKMSQIRNMKFIPYPLFRSAEEARLAIDIYRDEIKKLYKE